MGYKRISLSVPNWVYDRYLATLNTNRSNFVIDMMIRGIDSELSKGSESRAVLVMQELRNKDAELINLKRELELVKARVITQEKRKQEREAKKRQRAYDESMKRIARAQLMEVYDKADRRKK